MSFKVTCDRKVPGMPQCYAAIDIWYVVSATGIWYEILAHVKSGPWLAFYLRNADIERYSVTHFTGRLWAHIWNLVNNIFSCDQAALRTLLSVCLSVRLSVCLSVRPSVIPISLCSHHRIIMKFSGVLLPMTKVMCMQKVKVRGQRSRSQRPKPNLKLSGL